MPKKVEMYIVCSFTKEKVINMCESYGSKEGKMKLNL